MEDKKPQAKKTRTTKVPVLEEKKVIRTQIYHIEITTYEDNTSDMLRRNDGFHAIELLGLSVLIAKEVREQMKGNIKPDKIIRQVVVDAL